MNPWKWKGIHNPFQPHWPVPPSFQFALGGDPTTEEVRNLAIDPSSSSSGFSSVPSSRSSSVSAQSEKLPWQCPTCSPHPANAITNKKGKSKPRSPEMANHQARKRKATRKVWILDYWNQVCNHPDSIISWLVPHHQDPQGDGTGEGFPNRTKETELQKPKSLKIIVTSRRSVTPKKPFGYREGVLPLQWFFVAEISGKEVCWVVLLPQNEQARSQNLLKGDKQRDGLDVCHSKVGPNFQKVSLWEVEKWQRMSCPGKHFFYVSQVSGKVAASTKTITFLNCPSSRSLLHTISAIRAKGNSKISHRYLQMACDFLHKTDCGIQNFSAGPDTKIKFLDTWWIIPE